MGMRRATAVRDLMHLFASNTTCMAHGACRGARVNGLDNTDYAFEITSSTYRFGRGVTKELPFDLQFYRVTRPLVVTDPTLAKLPPVKAVADALSKSGVSFDLYDQVRVEPSQRSMMAIIELARTKGYDGFIGVGGGSVMDTTKLAAIYAANPTADFWDYVQKPFGKDLNPVNPMLPVICVPTTAGTGSESTGISIFEVEGKRVKNGVRKREIVPHLALVDVDHVMHMPESVASYTGFDILCHALESYTLIPFHKRSPRPLQPLNRPLSQGSNPVSDIWAREALNLLAKSFIRSIKEPANIDARADTLLASSIAGLGFGNAGVHLAHGLSYPLSGHVRDHHAPDYPTDHPLIPHGLSVCLTAPADFEFTGPACPDRHREAAAILGADVSLVRDEDAGKALADRIRYFMRELKIPNGLKEVGCEWGDIPKMADGAAASLSARQLCPMENTFEDIVGLYEKSWTVY